MKCSVWSKKSLISLSLKEFTKIFFDGDDVIGDDILSNVGPTGGHVTHKVEGVDGVTQELVVGGLEQLELVVSHHISKEKIIIKAWRILWTTQRTYRTNKMIPWTNK